LTLLPAAIFSRRIAAHEAQIALLDALREAGKLHDA